MLGAGLAGPPPATAESNTRDHTVVSNQELHAYVVRGERVRFAVTVDRQAIQRSDVAYTVTLRGPGGVRERCRIAAGSPVGSRCVLGPLRARRTGIWQGLVAATGAPDIEGINATGDGPAGDHPTLDWDLSVGRADGTAVRGRVWAPARYSMFNSPGGSPARVRAGAGPLTLFYLHDNGWLYRARYPSYNGIYSRHRATSLGVVAAATGVPVYRSTTNQAPRVLTIDHAAQDYYKVFFDRPDPAMPSSALTWDGRPVVLDNASAPITPTVTGLRYVETADLRTHAGAYELRVAHHAGVVEVVVDSDLDGSPGPADVRFEHPVDAGAAAVAVQGAWDGRATDGTVVDPRRPTRVWAVIERAGEIHFTNSDVEYRSGLEIQRLNGPAGGRSTLYWDDRSLRIDGKHRASTRVPDGRAGVDSRGGVHDLPTAGAGGGFGWGNERFIDDWTFVPVEISAQAAQAADLRILKVRDGSVPVAPGEPITWQVEVGNFGGTTATGVTMTDLDLDPEIGELALSEPSVGTVDGLTWAVGDLAPNSTATVTVTGTVATDAVGPVENRAVVASPDDPTGPPADPATTCEDNSTLPADGDGCDVVRTPLTPVPPTPEPPAADVVIDKRSADVRLDRPHGTGEVTWRVRVRNEGPDLAPAVRVTDLPGGGAELDVVRGPSRGTFDPATGRWDVGDLAPGATGWVVVRTTHPLADLTAGVANVARVTTPLDPWQPGHGCQANADLGGDSDNCDRDEVAVDPPARPEEPPRPTDRTPPLPAAGGPALVALLGGSAAILAGTALLLAGRRARRGGRRDETRGDPRHGTSV